MKCKKCGSENVTAQVINETEYRKGHGCLFSILFGVFYWTWLGIKWMFKYMVALFYWIVMFTPVIIVKARGRQFNHPDWYRKMMQRKGKTYNNQKTVFVCNSCGNRQNA